MGNFASISVITNTGRLFAPTMDSAAIGNPQNASLQSYLDDINNLDDRWLTPRLIAMGLEEEGMGWHSIRRYRNTWLRGQRTQEDMLMYWMGHRPQDMSGLYSHLHEELELRLEEAKRVGYGFDLSEAVIAPNAPRKSFVKSDGEIAA